MMRTTAARGHIPSPPQQARQRGWLNRFAVVGALLDACVWGWAGYQGAHAQVAVAGLWSLCAGTR